jgi:hypothetical protein
MILERTVQISDTGIPGEPCVRKETEIRQSQFLNKVSLFTERFPIRLLPEAGVQAKGSEQQQLNDQVETESTEGPHRYQSNFAMISGVMSENFNKDVPE